MSGQMQVEDADHDRERAAGASAPTPGTRTSRPTWPFALNVLTFRGDKICDVVAFAIKEIDADAQERYHRWDTEGTDATRLKNTFERFGLPDRL